MSFLNEESRLNLVETRRAKDEEERIEVREEARERAMYVRSYYLALVDEGFSESEALVLASES